MSAPEAETVASLAAKASNNPVVAAVLAAALLWGGNTFLASRDAGPQLAEQIKTMGLLQDQAMRNVAEKQTDAVVRLGRIEGTLGDLPIRVTNLEKRVETQDVRAANQDTRAASQEVRAGNQGEILNVLRKELNELRASVILRQGPQR